MASSAIKSIESLNDIVRFIDQQLTVTKSAVHSDSLKNPYNPDDLVDRDAEYRIYETMLRDDQISVAMAIKKDLVLAAGWDLVSDDDGQEEITETITEMLCNKISTSFDECLQEILSAYEFGFSITERVFSFDEDGKVFLKDLKTRHPATWMIYTDNHGDVEKYEQYGTTGTIDVPREALIHYINNPKFQNPYGTSDLRAAYDAWFIKTNIKKFYAIFMEKAASPIPVGRYDVGIPQAEVDTLFNILKRFQAKTAITIPKNVEIEFLKSESNGEVFQKAIHIFNLFIGRALYVPDLFGYSGEQTGGGSYSLGEHQIDIYFRHIGRRRGQLENVVNKFIVNPLIITNFGYQESMPYFKLRPVKETDIFKAIAAWSDAVKAKVYTPAKEEIDHFRSLLGFPVVELESDNPASETEDMENEDSINGDGANAEVEDGQSDPENMDKVEQFAANPYKHEVGDFYKRVDFKAIESQMIASENQINSELLPILKDTFSDYANQIADKKIIERQQFEKIEKLKLKNVKLIAKILDKYLVRAYEDARAAAESEIIKSNFARKAKTIDEKFLDVLDAENLGFIGDWEYNINKATRQAIINAIKDGTPVENVMVQVQDSVLNDAQTSIQRYARTKTTELMNKGRVAFFSDSDVVAAYQYSAILDGRTSDICQGLHGKIFAKGSEPIPPLHFNCRSVLIPITKYEEFSPDKKVGSKSIDAFIEENIGKGFSYK